MKIVICLYSLLLIQVNAFFLDDFRGAMHNVEVGFEKMLNNVVSNMEHTLHSTITAVENVLYRNGIFNEQSSRSDKYLGNARSPTYNVHDPASRYEQYEKNRSEKGEIDEVARQIRSSIESINKTLSNLVGSVGDSKFVSLSKSLENGTNRLSEVGKMLRNELEKLLKNENYGTAGININGDSAQDIINQIKTLEDIETNSKDSATAEEVRDVLDKVLEALAIKKDEPVHPDESLDTIISELKKDLGGNEFIKANKDNVDTAIQNFRNIEDSIFHGEPQHHRDFGSIFGSSTNYKPDVIEQAKLLIQDNQYSDTLFKSLSHAGTDVFGGMSLFNF